MSKSADWNFKLIEYLHRNLASIEESIVEYDTNMQRTIVTFKIDTGLEVTPPYVEQLDTVC